VAPGSSVEPHVLPLTGNFNELVFVNDNEVAAALPVFATVIDCCVLEVPGCNGAEVQRVGVRRRAKQSAMGFRCPIWQSRWSCRRQ
jgi:hypothetical protein